MASGHRGARRQKEIVHQAVVTGADVDLRSEGLQLLRRADESLYSSPGMFETYGLPT
jgi:hypothetical protein